ncbi:AraC family transcriptional regulator [Vallitalea okinawensis]|uniref:AraC family transcriptional regulator n=1 Tax=Vallitalea okinawensis TaxID=2078660 RepID=UPI0014788DB7|nr:AraC family transcriptional regulator [Vallitalea okinawensis]
MKKQGNKNAYKLRCDQKSDQYNKKDLYSIIQNAPSELQLKLIYNPLEDKPYYMVGSNPFTSTVKILKQLSNQDISGGKLLFTVDRHFTNIALHNHEFFEYIHISSGKVETIIDGDKVILETGDLCLLNKQAIHSIKTTGENNLSYNGIIMDEFRQRIVSMMPEGHPMTDFFLGQAIKKNYIHFKTRNYEKIQSMSHHMIEEYFLDKPESSLAVTGYFAVLITELIRLYPYLNDKENFEVEEEVEDTSIEKILRYLQQNYQHASITSVSNYFHFNPSYLSRYIKKETGKSFTQILKEIKLNKAKILLENSKRSVEEIAYEVGYNSVSHFYKVFKECEGITPVEYKGNKIY